MSVLRIVRVLRKVCSRIRSQTSHLGSLRTRGLAAVRGWNAFFHQYSRPEDLGPGNRPRVLYRALWEGEPKQAGVSRRLRRPGLLFGSRGVLARLALWGWQRGECPGTLRADFPSLRVRFSGHLRRLSLKVCAHSRGTRRHLRELRVVSWGLRVPSPRLLAWSPAPHQCLRVDLRVRAEFLVFWGTLRRCP